MLKAISTLTGYRLPLYAITLIEKEVRWTLDTSRKLQELNIEFDKSTSFDRGTMAPIILNGDFEVRNYVLSQSLITEVAIKQGEASLEKEHTITAKTVCKNFELRIL